LQFIFEHKIIFTHCTFSFFDFFKIWCWYVGQRNTSGVLNTAVQAPAAQESDVEGHEKSFQVLERLEEVM
jgi:hypothetical protein